MIIFKMHLLACKSMNHISFLIVLYISLVLSQVIVHLTDSSGVPWLQSVVEQPEKVVELLLGGTEQTVGRGLGTGWGTTGQR